MAQPRFLKSEPLTKAALLCPTVQMWQVSLRVSTSYESTKGDYFFYTAELRVSIYQLCKQDFGPVTYILPPQMYNFHFDSKAFLVTEVDF